MKKDYKELFRRYVRVQYSGMYNMFTQGYQVMKLINCTDVVDYFYIMNNYDNLKEQYPEVWEEAKKIGVEINEKIYS